MVGELNQQKIDELLLGDRPLQELKPFFSNPEEILKYHAHFMAEHFPSSGTKSECESCQRRSAEFNVAFLWRGRYSKTGTIAVTLLFVLVTMMVGHAIDPQRDVSFTTTHGLCNDCLKQIRFRRMLGKTTEKFCLFVIVLSGFVLLLALVSFLDQVFSKLTAHGLLTLAACLFGGMVLLAVGMLGADRAVRWCVPKSLKFVSKRPFQLIRLQKQ